MLLLGEHPILLPLSVHAMHTRASDAKSHQDGISCTAEHGMLPVALFLEGDGNYRRAIAAHMLAPPG